MRRLSTITHRRTRVNVRYLEATDIERDGTACLQGVDAVLVPGGRPEDDATMA